MKYLYAAMTNSTTHPTFEKEFKSELALKRYLNKFLNQYEPDAWVRIKNADGWTVNYSRKVNGLYWNP